ncbi:hypothetical protein AVEN_242867-1 [Araneus ventricosus]|uniref:Uncharacterized protein n=1 Tax=Araneus ventricosus TaxID=182803 RepID=A0A4Y2R5W9_ARAVE|nr:hypothetical protein AVEN_242867-1 [Araneus ventricosus]
MKQFIQSLPKYGECFRYAKTVRIQVERGSFYCPRHKKTVIRFPLFRNNGGQRKKAWDSFKYVVHRCLENTKDPLYKTIVQRMLTAYEVEGCQMSLKAHLPHSHIVKSRLKDFTRMPVISRDDTKEDGTSAY